MPKLASDIVGDLPAALSSLNERRIFIHDPTVLKDPGYSNLCLSAQYRLPERALWLSDPDDLVLLSYPIETAYLDYVHSLGAGPENVMHMPNLEGGGLIETLLAMPCMSSQFAAWADSKATPIRVDTFCATQETETLTNCLSQNLAQALPPTANAAATLMANHKACVYAVLDTLGIPKLPGCLVSTAGQTPDETINQVQQVISAMGRNHKHVVVRTDYSSGGSGNLLIDSRNATGLGSWLRQQAGVQNLLVEAYLPWRSSPNVQFWLSPQGTIELFQITDQRINGGTNHIGNEFPAQSNSSEELLRQSTTIAAWLASIGVRGFIGIDFIDTYSEGIRFVEVNARVNGSTYATAIALRINHLRTSAGYPPLNAWRMKRQVPTAVSNFANLMDCASDLIYDHSKRAGVIPYWTGSLQHGCFSCVTLAEEPGQLELLESAFLSRVTGP